jgi:uncharacterized hydantoinase/oxoprolinase family protein
MISVLLLQNTRRAPTLRSVERPADHVPVARALGVDIGNAKLKLCLGGQSDDGVIRTHWMSRPLPYDDRRRYRRFDDFERGVPEVIDEHLRAQTCARDDVRVVVAVTSSGYAYPTYREGVQHAIGLLARVFPHAECFALAHDGSLQSSEVVATGAPEILGRATFTNGMGAAHLARRLGVLGAPANGLVVDTGGTTSQVAMFVDGVIEPHTTTDGARYLEHRLRHGKATWVGTQTTPLESLAREVPVDGRMYPVIPRGVTFDSVAAALSLLDPEVARKLSLFGLHPGREDALRAIADAVNLDFDLASRESIEALAQHFLACAIDQLSESFRRALESAPPRSRQRAMVFGLGARWLTSPALERAGVPRDGILQASDVLPPALADVASCYGACHIALERLLERELPASLS